MDKIWIGSPSDVRQGTKAEEALAQTSDAKYWDEETGIVKVDHSRWKQAQEFESTGWLKHWVGARDDRNAQHKAGFDGYKAVPKDLGKVIEIGCGPFTQLQTISEGRTISEVTLLDPLLDRYKVLQNCTYRNDNFKGLPTTLICNQAESLHAVAAFDTAICINVLEHVQDVQEVLARLHRALVPGGVVIFGERCYDGLNINEVYDVGHPIRVKMKVFTDWENQFEPLYRVMPNSDDPLNKEHYFIGRKC